jgi:hypothetical protein
MTGKQGRFEKTVAGGTAGRAPATILRVSRLLPAQADANGTSEGGTFRVRVRVEPADQAMFEASMTMHVTAASSEPRAGQRIPVIFHEGSVAWDTGEPRPELGSISGS